MADKNVEVTLTVCKEDGEVIQVGFCWMDFIVQHSAFLFLIISLKLRLLCDCFRPVKHEAILCIKFTFQGVISEGAGGDMVSKYTTIIYYHEDRPRWFETVKVGANKRWIQRDY